MPTQAEIEGIMSDMDRVIGEFDADFYRDQADFLHQKVRHYLEDTKVQGARPHRWHGKTVVFVPRHLSQLDSIPLGLAIHELSRQAELGMDPPAFVAGTNLFMGRFGKYLEKMRAIPIERGWMANRVYYRSVRDKIARLLRQGVHLTVFPEAGRSRDGSLRPITQMFLDMADKAQCGCERDILIQPVPLVYDWVPEASYSHWLAYSSDLRKRHRLLGNALYYGLDLSFYLPRYFLPDPVGSIHIDFGEPKTVKELRIECAEHEPPIRFRQHAANFVRGEIAKRQAIPATGLVAHHLAQRADLGHARLRERVSETILTMQAQGMNVASLAELGADVVDYGLHILERKGVVGRRRGGLRVKKPQALEFCARTVAEQMQLAEELAREYPAP